MAGQSDGLAGILCGPLQNVMSGPIVLNEIQVCGRKFPQLIAEITHNRDRFQENLWKNHRRTNIKVDSTSIQTLCHCAKQTEIPIRRGPQFCAGGCWMNVDDIGTDRDMYRHRNVLPLSSRQNAQRFEFERRRVSIDKTAEAFSHSN